MVALPDSAPAVLIIGAVGFIGSHVCEGYREDGSRTGTGHPRAREGLERTITYLGHSAATIFLRFVRCSCCFSVTTLIYRPAHL